jgi:hypothetical protein
VISMPSNAEEAFEVIDREELHKILFVNGLENEGLHSFVINDLYAWHRAEVNRAVIEALDEVKAQCYRGYDTQDPEWEKMCYVTPKEIDAIKARYGQEGGK